MGCHRIGAGVLCLPTPWRRHRRKAGTCCWPFEKGGYGDVIEESERRRKAGQKQRLCIGCLSWRWPDERPTLDGGATERYVAKVTRDTDRMLRRAGRKATA